MNIVYIHGNTGTSATFNFIRSHITGHTDILLEYDSASGFYANHEAMLAHLKDVDDILFVAHSLGGIHALHLAHALGDRTLGGVTMATPYGGCEAAPMVACFLPFSRLIKDIRPTGRPIVEGDRMQAPERWTNIVTTGGGSHFLIGPNDGVVSFQSMRHRRDIRLVDIACNHFEVVLSPLAVDVIRQCIAEAERERRIEALGEACS